MGVHLLLLTATYKAFHSGLTVSFCELALTLMILS